MKNQIILVDEHDNEMGIMPKLEVHKRGLLHRAFSVFIFNGKGEVLLQQRALNKYHSAGLWSNTCCSHPYPGEETINAANRRLMEEMGISCILEPAFNFIYRAELDNGLTEYEFDHVFFGITDTVPVVNMKEVNNTKYMDLQLLSDDITRYPGKYTAWLRRSIYTTMQQRRVMNN